MAGVRIFEPDKDSGKNSMRISDKEGKVSIR
jgi:hypothetical protein